MGAFFCSECIAAMPAIKFWVATALAAAATLAALWAARTNFVKARLIEDMPTSRVRSASQGYVELTGLATGQDSRTPAPLTGRPCLWWRYKIERYRRSGRSSSWSTVEKDVSTTPFFMDDGTGICRVEPEGAEIACLHRKVWYGHSRRPSSASIAASKGLLDKVSMLGGSNRYRYTEYLIREGDPLYLLGHFISDASGRRTLTVDQVTGRIVRQWKRDYDQLMVRFDADGNGILDEEEWQTVRHSAREQARAEQRATNGEPAEHALVKPDNGGLPFIIGSRGQDHLSRQYRWRAALGAIAFLAAGAMTTWLLTGRFGM